MTSHTQLTAISDEEMFDLAPPKPRTSRWRGVGLAVMVVGFVCMVGATWPRKQVTVTPRQRFGQMRDTILKAFTSESLLEASSLTTQVEFVFGEVGAEEEPSAMEIDAHISDDPAAPNNFTVELTFNANADAGADLKNAFDKLLDSLVSFYPDSEDEIRKAILLTQDGDSVLVSATDGPGVKDLNEMAEVMKKGPKLHANFKYGRDLDAIYKHRNEHILKVWSGLHFTLDTKFKPLVINTVKHMLPVPVGDDEAHWAEALALVVGKLEFRYKKEEELGDLLTNMPTLSEGFTFFGESFLFEMPDSRLKVFKDIIASINGLEMVQIRGLSEDTKIAIDFTNFKPGKLLGAIIETVEDKLGGNGGEDQ